MCVWDGLVSCSSIPTHSTARTLAAATCPFLFLFFFFVVLCWSVWGPVLRPRRESFRGAERRVGGGQVLHKKDQKASREKEEEVYIDIETSSPFFPLAPWLFFFLFFSVSAIIGFLVFFHRFSCVIIALRASSDWCSQLFGLGGGAEQMSEHWIDIGNLFLLGVCMVGACPGRSLF